MRKQPFLCRLVVERRNDQQPVCADRFRKAALLDGVLRVVAARADNNRNAVRNALHDKADDFLSFIRCKRRRFAGGAERNDGVRAGSDLQLNEIGQRLIIDSAVVKRRNQCDCGTCKDAHNFSPLSNSCKI